MIPRLSYGFAKSQGVLLTSVAGDPDATVCHFKPGADVVSLIEAQRVAGRMIAFVEITPEVYEADLGRIYRDSASEAAEAAADDDLASLADNAAAVDDLLDQNDGAPVVRLINALLLEAVKEGASDVHIETEERRLVVRFRIDGVLREVIEPKRALAPLLVSRIKVMGKLDIAEKRHAAGRAGLAARGRLRSRRADLDHSLAVRREGRAAPPRPGPDAARASTSSGCRARIRRAFEAHPGAARRPSPGDRPHGIGQNDVALCRARAAQRPVRATS